MTRRIALYSAVDDTLTHYDVDVDAATLTKRASVKLPAKVQYAWPHPSRKYLYMSTSSGGPRVKSDYNDVAAYAIEGNGALVPLGEPRPMTRRAVHVCLDPAGHYIFSAHNYPAAGITVHAIASDGSVAAEIDQPPLDYGLYPHQVRMFPSGRTALLVDRGNNAQDGKPENPGALRSFGFDNGKLCAGQVIAPNGGYGFGPRHIDFHPSLPWMYVSDERRNRLYMFRFADDRLDDAPVCARETLADPQNVRPRQLGGPIHVDPTGRFVYVANRADASVEYGGSKFFAGGENNIAVYSLDQKTGVPTLIQHAETHSFHVRTFACDPSGRLLVTASIRALAVLQAGQPRKVPAALSIFRVSEHGRLDFVRQYAVETDGNQLQYWMGITGLA